MPELVNALICFLFFVSIRDFLFSVECNQISEQVCKNLQSGSEKVYLIGLLKRHFILITNKFNLFDLSPASLDVDSNRLYLQESVSLKTLETWKPMYDFMNGQQLKMAITVRDSVYDYVMACIFDYEVGSYAPAFVYNLDKRTFQSFDLMRPQASKLGFSSFKEYHIFMYWEDPGIMNVLKGYRFNTKTKLLNDSEKLVGDHYIYDDKEVVLCQADANHITNNCPGLNPPPLHFESGFEDGHKFYIFSGMEAYILDRSLYQNLSNITVKSEKVPLKNFFICGQRPTSTLDNSNEFSGSPTLLILCFVVALLLMAGLAIWFYMHRRHKGDNLAKQPKKMTSDLKSTKSSRRQKSNKSIRSLRSHKSSSKRKSSKSLKSRKLSSKKSKSIKTRKSSKRSLKGKSKSRSLKRKSSSKLKRKSTSRLKRKSSSKRKSHKSTLKHNSSKQLQHLSKRNSLRKHSKRASLGSLKKIAR